MRLTIPGFLRLIAAVLLGNLFVAPVFSDDCSVTFQPSWPVRKFTQSITEEKDYRQLLKTQSGIAYVKFLLEQQDGQRAFFQNSSVYDFHYPFLTAEVAEYRGLTPEQYNEFLFNPASKKFSAGAIYLAKCLKIAEFQEPGVMGFSVYFKEEILLDEIVQVRAKLAAAMPFGGDRLVYLFERKKDYLKYKRPLLERGVPSIALSTLSVNQARGAVYHAAKSYGYLRALAPEQVSSGDYSSRDILLLAETPIDIGPVSGIISTEPQVPHSHVILRTINQNVPNLFVPQATSDPRIAKYTGQLVELEARSDGTFGIRGAEEMGEGALKSAAEDYFKSRVPRLPRPRFDLESKEAFSWQASSRIAPELITTYGAKGVQFAALDQALRIAGVDRAPMDGAFLVPFSHYQLHLSQALTAGACDKAAEKSPEPLPVCKQLASEGKPLRAYFERFLEDSARARKPWLAFGRELIKETPLAPETSRLIRENFLRVHPGTCRLRLRSSTNTEDLPGLNGAGWYESKGACIEDDNPALPRKAPSACMTATEKERRIRLIELLKQLGPEKHKDLIAELESDLKKKRPLDKAVRGVYASVWSDKAFLNREYYGIPHLDVFMGILAHPSFVDEEANGVAVARGQADGSIEISFSAQVQDTSITNPEIPYAAAETSVVRASRDGGILELRRLSSSNLTGNGAPVLTDADLKEAARQMTLVFNRMLTFRPGPEGRQPAFDIEFILGPNRQVILKQVRPLGEAGE